MHIKFRLNRIKLIHVEHGADLVRFDNMLKFFLSYIYDMIFGNLVFIFSDKLITVSNNSKEFVRKYFFIKKKLKNIEVVYRGIDVIQIENIKPDNIIKKKYSCLHGFKMYA